ncbi:MAG: helix-turn-helix domain-containing protein [Parvibaculaceae bacterium]
MTNQFEFSTDDKSEARRRLHLKDITTDLSDDGAHTAGSDLRTARERRGEDLRAIALSLRIRREQLEALEESRYDDLPGRAYAVGFIRSYAEYLGLDSAEIVDRYKSELDSRFAGKAPVIGFPVTNEPMRMPRGTFLIIAAIIGAGIYGGYMMTRSADHLMASRVPAQPDKIEAKLANPQEPDERPAGLGGDPASAATRPASDATAQQLLGEGAPTEPTSVYAVPLVTASPVTASPVTAPPADVAAAAPAGTQVAALTPPTTVTPAAVTTGSVVNGSLVNGSVATGDMVNGAIVHGTVAPVATASSLPVVPQGAVYGAENTDARVIIRARKPDAWVRIEDAQGHVLIERTMKVGDTYAAPNVPGVILVARDASAFELVVDQQSLGLAGPPTLVLTGKPLDPSALIAAMPRVAPTPAEEAAALAPVTVAPATTVTR